MKTIKVEMVKIDMKTGEKRLYVAEVSNKKDDAHKIYSLTYEGYRTEWTEVLK